MWRLMDWTLVDNMFVGLFFCRGGHTPFVQAGTEASDTGPVVVKPDPRCSWKGHSGVPVSVLKVRSLVRLCNHSAFHWWPPNAPHARCCYRQMKWWVVRWAQMGVSIWDAVHSHPVDRWPLSWTCVQAPWHGVLWENVAPLRRSPAGWISARMGSLSAGVGRRHPVTISRASLMAVSKRWIWALRHHTGAQYSAVEWTRARVATRSVVCSSTPTRASKPSHECDEWCQLFVKRNHVDTQQVKHFYAIYIRY